MRAAYLFLLAPLLGGCLGPAPWSDWKGEGTQYSATEPTGAAGAAPVGDMTFGPRNDVETATLAPPPGVTSSDAPFVSRPVGNTGSTDEADAMTAPPPDPAPTLAANSKSGMGGPYAPLDLHEKAGAASGQSATVMVRTLPLMVTGTGTKTN